MYKALTSRGLSVFYLRGCIDMNKIDHKQDGSVTMLIRVNGAPQERPCYVQVDITEESYTLPECIPFLGPCEKILTDVEGNMEIVTE